MAHSKMKGVFHEQLSWMCVLSEATSDTILDNGELNLLQNIKSNRNGTDKIFSISEKHSLK